MAQKRSIEKGIQGALSFGAYGARQGSRLRKKYKLAPGVGEGVGAGVGALVGGISGYLSGVPNTRMGREAYERTGRQIRSQVMQNAGKSARSAGADVRQAFARRKIGGPLSAGTEAAIRGQIYNRANEALIPIEHQLEMAGVSDELAAKRIGEYENRQGWQDTALAIGAATRDIVGDYAEGGKELELGKGATAGNALILPGGFEGWDYPHQMAWARRNNVTLPENWKEMTPEDRMTYLSTLGWNPMGPTAAVPTKWPKEDQFWWFADAAPGSAYADAEDQSATATPTATPGSAEWEAQKDAADRRGTPANAGAIITPPVKKQGRQSLGTSPPKEDFSQFADAAPGSAYDIPLNGQPATPTLPAEVPLSPEQKAGMPEDTPPEWMTRKDAVPAPPTRQAPYEPENRLGTVTSDAYTEHMRYQQDVQGNIWTEEHLRTRTPEELRQLENDIRNRMVANRDAPAGQPQPDASNPGRLLAQLNLIKKVRQAKIWEETAPQGQQKPVVEPAPQKAAPTPAPAPTPTPTPTPAPAAPAPAAEVPRTEFEQTLRDLIDWGEGGFYPTPFNDPKSGVNVGIGRSLTHNGMNVQTEIIPFLREQGVSDAEIMQRLAAAGINPNRAYNQALTEQQFNTLFPNGINAEQGQALLDNDIKMFTAQVENIITPEVFNAMDDTRKQVLIDMMYTLGASDFAGFVEMRKALQAGDFNKAADEMRNSQWYKDVGPRRADPLIDQMRTGDGSNDQSQRTNTVPPIVQDTLPKELQDHIQKTAETPATPAELKEFQQASPESYQAVLNPASPFAGFVTEPYSFQVLMQTVAQLGDAQAAAIFNRINQLYA